MEYVVLTGEIVNGQIGCSASGRKFFARPVFGTVFQSIPSKEWLDKYKNEFFGLVDYAYAFQGSKNQHDKPLFMGVVPVNNAKYQGDNIENIHKIQTEKFSVELNDAQSTFTITSDKVTILIDADGRISIKNNATSLKKILTAMVKTYIKTKTIKQEPLSPDSINSAMDNLSEINKIFK